jgi:hypothetical protein
MKKVASRLLLIIICVLSIHYSNAQNPPIITSVSGKLIRVTPRLADIDRKSMYGATLKKTRQGEGLSGVVDIERAEESIFKKQYPDNSNGNRLQNSPQDNNFLASIASSTNLNMDGQTFPGFTPSDNNMAVGPNHIIQIINHSSGSAFKVWNKSGTVIQASTVLSSLTGLSGSGDPVVMYDQLADRWVLTEFGKTGIVTYINTLIIAVSATGDPAGSWNVYSYNVGAFFVDYPKYAVWHNAYYATTNDFNTLGTSYLGSSFYAFDRNAMIAGAPTATMIRTRLTGSGDRYYSMAPVCMEGTTNSNQSGLFSFLQDNTWVGAPADSLFIFEFTPNFASPASSVIGPTRAMVTQPYNTNTGNLNQQGTTQTIQSLSERLMNKIIYRNFGSSESIVCNTTDLQNSRTGVHWWELRRPESGNWNIFQEGLWQPASDNNHRFMGSIAINATGDIGLLYNVTGSTAYPSARFTARNSCDPLGQMTLAETVVMNGTTYNGTSRYGDYNSLSIDPINGSFWGTAQYNAPGYGTYGNWVTRIVNFSVTPCSSANPGTVSGTTPLCIGQTATYSSNGDAGGIWSSSNTSAATVDASGLVTAVAAGTTNITYTVGGASSFKTLTVDPNVSAGTVSGSSSICVGANATYSSNGTAGGTWSSNNTSVATVDVNTGIVTGVAVGAATITYSVSNSCNSSTASQSVDVTECAGPSVTCPANINGSATSGCSVNISVPDPSTSNTTTLTWVMTGATTGNSSSTGINNVGTANFKIGITTITYTAKSSDGVTATCSFTVTVTDNTAASITCPANISNTQNGANKCSAVINTPNPNTSANCSVSSLTWIMTGATTGSSPASGINYVGSHIFNVGITTVTYTLTNGANNIATCSFTVTVKNKKCPNSPAEPLLTEATRNNDKLDLKVFPNPSETYFTLLIESNSTENVEISVYAINGKMIQKLKGNPFEVFRFGDSYSAGTYVVKVNQGSKQAIEKLIK